MPHFEIFDLVKWLHFVALSVGGGAMVVALLISGLEDEREDLRGLAATLWKKVVAWSFRLALLLGATLWYLRFRQHFNLFTLHYFHLKMALVLALVAVTEMAPKALAVAKRGAALMALLLFLLATFVTFNANAFPRQSRPVAEPAALAPAN